MWGRTTRALLVALLALLGIAGSAQGRQVQQYFYSGESFEPDGSSPSAIGVDGPDQKVLVVGRGSNGQGFEVRKFNLDGSPAGFSSRSGETSFQAGEFIPQAIAVDQSGVGTGRFYVISGGNAYGYTIDGAPLQGFPVRVAGACGATVGPDGHLWVASEQLGAYSEFDGKGQATGQVLFVGASLGEGSGRGICRIAIDSAGNFYVAKGERLVKYDSSHQLVLDLGLGVPTEFFSRGSPLPVFDRGDNTLFELSADSSTPVTQLDPAGNPITAFGDPDPAHFSYSGIGEALGFAVNFLTHDVYVLANQGQAAEVDIFSRDPNSVEVPTVHTSEVEDLQGSAAILVGTVNPDGVDTTDCHFEWGSTTNYGNGAACAQGDVLSGVSGENQLTASIAGLIKGATYHYRLRAKNANGVWSSGADRELNAADPPIISGVGPDHITSDSGRVNLKINPNGETTRYYVELGTDTTYGINFPIPNASVARTRPINNNEEIEVILGPVSRTQQVHGLNPATEYHYRVVAENAAGRTEGDDHVFKTFALPSVDDAGCTNKQARQQTGSGELLDCRGYELVSAPDTGGYDVRSGLSQGVDAISTSAGASDAALYSMRSGTIPGVAGHPTNRGADPYLATRGANGWSTRYVGLPSNNPFATGPFASSLSGFDEALESFSFGGEEICDPCFADGSTDVPLRQGSKDIAQGMAGSMDPPGPANPTGIVEKPLSADGSHLLFETTAQFEPDANSGGTDATIYSRNLKANTTEVVSTDENGDPIQAGSDLAELDVSKDGSRTLFGEELSSDSQGNRYYHLYLHISGTEESVELTPGATEGALYAGMTEDGTKAFFTTKDQLLSADTDESADAYGVQIPGPGSVAPQILSQGSGAGDTNSCSPAGDPDSWNVPSGKGKCDVIAFAGGAGVASEAGDFYFLSPELLDGANGTQDQANLYLVEGGSTTPQFVATIDSSLVKPPAQLGSHPLLPANFAGSFANPEALTVDQSNGDVYVVRAGSGVFRFDSSGAPKNFTEGPGLGTNRLPGLSLFGESAAEVAVDNSGGPFDGSIYATNSSAGVRVFSPTGASLGQLDGSGTSLGGFGEEACGVAVDQSNGDVYIGDYGNHIWRYSPIGGSPSGDSAYTVTGISTAINPCAVAADNGNVYAANWSEGPVFRFLASAFGPSSPGASGTQVDARALALSVDPFRHELYVDEGNQIVTFDAAGQKQQTIGTGAISGSRGVAVNATTHHVYASRSFASSIAEFGYEADPYVPINNPAIIHATHQAATHDPSDFQVTPDGKYAAFASVMPLDGYDNGGRYEVFRSERGGGTQCLSCAPTLAIPSSDASLTPYGLSLLSDGRVFFTTAEQLTLRDSNEKRDAYEWSGGKQELISTGTSPSDSELLSASADGTDVFFFTRQKLVPQDENGDNVRLYDAREDGGFEFGPPSFQCAASDECHGASTKAPVLLGAATTAGTPGQFSEEAKPSKCAKGKVKRRGRCVKRKPRKHGHAGKRAHKRAKANRGGGK